MTFLSNPNGFKNSFQAAHDAPFPMAFPLGILGLLSIFVGYLTKDMFIGLGSPFWNNAIFILPENLNIIDAEFIPVYIKWIPFFASLIGSFFSIFLYHLFSRPLFRFYGSSNLLSLIYVFFNKKWFFDRLQNELLVSFLLKIGYSTTYKLIDKGLIEVFGPSGLSKSALKLSKQISLLQSGKINQYAFLIFILFIVFISIALVFSLFGNYITPEFVFIILLCIFFNAVF
jgi:NADH-ubiquinone oxidoreductase chain 5